MTNKTKPQGRVIQVYIPDDEEILEYQQEQPARQERPGFLTSLFTVPHIILAILAGAIMMAWAGPEAMLIILTVAFTVIAAAFATWATGTQTGSMPYVVGSMVILAGLALDIDDRIFANAMLYGHAFQKVSQPILVVAGVIAFLLLFKRR